MTGKQITIRGQRSASCGRRSWRWSRSYSVGGRELLDGYGANGMSSSGRGQVLIPWPNRLQDGSYEFCGRRYRWLRATKSSQFARCPGGSAISARSTG